MLGLTFTGRWIRFCHLCNEVIYYPNEHLLLFCRKTNEFRESLWPRLIFKFGLNFLVILYLRHQKDNSNCFFRAVLKS